jgi:hypothetical protein
MGKVHLLHDGVADTFGWSPRNERFHASFSAPLRTVKCAARQLLQLARADDVFIVSTNPKVSATLSCNTNRHSSDVN